MHFKFIGAKHRRWLRWIKCVRLASGFMRIRPQRYDYACSHGLDMGIFEIVWSLLQGRRKVEIRKSLRVSRQRAVLLNMVRRLQVLYSERFGTRQGTFFWSRMLFRSTLQVFIQASFFISKSSTMDTSEVYLRSAMLIVEAQ